PIAMLARMFLSRFSFLGLTRRAGGTVKKLDLISLKIGLAQLIGTGLVAHLATGAQQAYQALGKDRRHGVGQQVRLHAEIDEPADSRNAVLGVQGSENHVAGLSSLTCDLRGFLITDFADVDDIRILSEDTAQLGGEGLAGARVNLDLRYIIDAVFNRVFHGDDVHLVTIDFPKTGIKRGTLASTRGTTNDEQAVRLGNDALDLFVQILGHA